MSYSLNLEIAGIHFSISCSDALIDRGDDPAYTSFWKCSHFNPYHISIPVKLIFEEVPSTGGKKKIFDSEQSWLMFHHEDNYYLKLAITESHEHFILARFSSGFTEAHIYCGQRLIKQKNGNTFIANPICYPLDQLMLMYILSGNHGALVHGAGLALHERGFIFLGKSGAGKSTLSRLFLTRKHISGLSDDRIVVRKIDDAFQAFGTPWSGEAGIAENKKYPLEGIFFIHHGTENSIRNLTPKEAVEKLIPVTSIPWYDEITMSNILLFCEDVVLHVPSYDLYFTPGSEVLDFFERFVTA